MSKTNSTSSQSQPRREIPEALRAKILERQGWRCAYCEADLTITSYHIDHKKPLCRGGSNHPNNLCAACKSCNQRKGGWVSAREYRQWLQECQNAPEGTWSCRNHGHAQYVGERWVATSEFNKGDSWCRSCRSRYEKARWQRVGPLANAWRRECYMLDGDYRLRSLSRAREHYQSHQGAINQARRERYQQDADYRANALARTARQREKRLTQLSYAANTTPSAHEQENLDEHECLSHPD